MTDWASAENVISGSVTLSDFDMLTPTADLKVVEKTVTNSSHNHKSYELYDYPAHYRKDSTRGKRLAQVRMEAEEVNFKLRRYQLGKGAVAEKRVVRLLGLGRRVMVRS